MNLGYLSLLLNPFSPKIPWQMKRLANGQAQVRVADSDAMIYPQVIGGSVGPVALPQCDRRNTKMGPAERYAKLLIVRHGLKQLYSEMLLPISGHRYAPDLMLVDDEHGVYIDIENDEPCWTYDTSRQLAREGYRNSYLRKSVLWRISNWMMRK